MKEYITPELEMKSFLTSDIVALSLNQQEDGEAGEDQINNEITWVPKGN